MGSVLINNSGKGAGSILEWDELEVKVFHCTLKEHLTALLLNVK